MKLIDFVAVRHRGCGRLRSAARGGDRSFLPASVPSLSVVLNELASGVRHAVPGDALLLSIPVILGCAETSQSSYSVGGSRPRQDGGRQAEKRLMEPNNNKAMVI